MREYLSNISNILEGFQRNKKKKEFLFNNHNDEKNQVTKKFKVVLK